MYEQFRIKEGQKVILKDFPTDFSGDFRHKLDAETKLQGNIAKLAELQDKLYAQSARGVLIILQAMDAAGKDSIIKNVMSGLNPQGCQVFSFKQPSAEELDHDFMWRYSKNMPKRGNIVIFNRSYYEEVLVVRVHPELLDKQRIPKKFIGRNIWKQRFEDIKFFEDYMTRQGFAVVKIFLNISKKEQKERFLDRINLEEKNWKFSAFDLRERALWKEYMSAFEDVIAHTSTEESPWFVIPADKKWFARAAVSEIIVSTLKNLDLQYPDVPPEHKLELMKAKDILLEE